MTKENRMKMIAAGILFAVMMAAAIFWWGTQRETGADMKYQGAVFAGQTCQPERENQFFTGGHMEWTC